ncbi:MAG: hypothetical protein ACK5QH_06095 [Rubrivivax sp.]|jgi:hypothetical protein
MQNPALNSPPAPEDAPAAPYPRVRTVRVWVDSANQPHALPEQVDVSGGGVLIQFLLLTNGWAFPAEAAITVQDGGTQFPCAAWTLAPQQAALLDADTSPGIFNYTIHVVHTGTGQRLRLDPTIRNDF